MKAHNILFIGKGYLLCDLIHNLWTVSQHFADPVGALHGAGKFQDHKLRHEHTKHGHNSIFNNSRDISYLKSAGNNAAAAEPIYQNHKEIDGKIRQSVKACKHFIHLYRSNFILTKSIVETLGFMFLFIKSPHHSHSRDVFQQNCAHFIQQLLQLLKQRRSLFHDKTSYQDQQYQHCQQHPSQIGIFQE